MNRSIPKNQIKHKTPLDSDETSYMSGFGNDFETEAHRPYNQNCGIVAPRSLFGTQSRRIHFPRSTHSFVVEGVAGVDRS